MTRTFLARCALLPVVLGAALAAGCQNGVTLPEPDPITQGYNVFTGPLDPLGRNVYLITLDSAVPVQVMLAGAVTGNPVRSVNPVLTLEIGFWDGAECQPLEKAETAPRFTSALQRQLDRGTYCVAVSDQRGMAEQVGIVVRVAAPPVLGTGGTAGTDSFSSAITPGGRASRSFEASTPGIVSLTLSNLTPSGAVTGIGIGLQDPGGTGCSLARVVTAAPGASPQLSAQVDAGFYCAVVFDAGNFATVQNFTLSVTHP